MYSQCRWLLPKLPEFSFTRRHGYFIAADAAVAAVLVGFATVIGHKSGMFFVIIFVIKYMEKTIFYICYNMC